MHQHVCLLATQRMCAGLNGITVWADTYPAYVPNTGRYAIDC